MTRRSRIAALVAVAALALAGCSSNDAKKSDITNAMTDAGLDNDQAQCVADGIWDEYGDDQDTINEIAGAADPSDFPKGTEQTIDQVLNDCLGNSTSTDTTAPADAGTGDSTTTTAGG